LSIPLYVAPAGTNGASDTEGTGAGKTALAGALAAWMESSSDARRALSLLLEGRL